METTPHCPAKKSEWRKCKKQGHFATACRSSQRVETIVDSNTENDIAFMGTVNTERTVEEWFKEISLNGEKVTFKLNTGTSVTGIPSSMYSRARDGGLMTPPKKIERPDNCSLKVLGIMRAHIKTERTETRQNVYVVSNLLMPLMGLPALIKSNLIQQVASVQEGKQEKSHQYRATFPSVSRAWRATRKLQDKTERWGSSLCSFSSMQSPITYERTS